MDNSQLLALKKDQIPNLAKTLSADDVEFLVETLREKAYMLWENIRL